MSQEIQGEILRPSPVERNQRLPYGGAIPPQGSKPFTVYHQHAWAFVVPADLEGLPSDLVELARPFSVDAPRDDISGGFLGVRSWSVPAIHPRGEWLPQVECIPHEPGGNGCALTSPDPKAAKIDPYGMHAGMEKKKATRIPQFDPRLGRLNAPLGEETYAEYQRRYLLTSGFYYHVYAGVRMVLINRGRDAEPAPDFGWIYGFRRKVVTAGIVEPMARESLNRHLLTIRNRMGLADTKRKSGHLTPEAFRQIRNEAETLTECMNEAHARQFGSVREGPTVAHDAGSAPESDEGQHFAGELDMSAALAETPAPEPKPRRGSR